ncbi:MAG: hypothetical protein LBO82_05710 [Synergistaceae bacterium]|jgi:hypothetical protein|nr:hypothetical protein [Synergistaceae bacterium]
MTATTETREPEMGLTFEKVWAMFQESDRRMQKLSEETAQQMQETDRQLQEVARRMRETDRRMKETDRQIKETDRQMKETDRQMKETDRQMKETDRQMKRTDMQIGRLGNRFGELAEHLVAPNIIQKFNALGFHFDDISGLRRIIKDEGSGQKIAEFDILLENGESIIGVEVKSKPSYDDVEDHVRRLEILRLNKDGKGDRRKIHGALAGAIMPDIVRTAALKAGLYVITQTGDTVKIDVPEGFIPKTW